MPPDQSKPHLVRVQPNCSLSWRQALIVYAWFCVASLGLAGALALRGFWPVLPFAGLEMIVLGVALRISMRRSGYREIISIYSDRIVIDKGRREQHERLVFPLHWARVTLQRARIASYPSRLLISSHGRSCEVGRCLTEGERRGLRRRLEQLIGSVARTPVGLARGELTENAQR